MAKKYEISEEGLNELREARRTNRDKSVERRLHALILHAEGNTGKKVSELTGYNEKYLYKLYRKYLSGGIEAITGNHYGGGQRGTHASSDAENTKTTCPRKQRAND